MRGRTFKNTFIIADEMQNSSPNQMKMLITRLGENSRLVITGDLEQTDREKENGLEDFISKLDNFNDSSDLIHRIHFHSTDIERSEVVKKIVDIYNYKKTNISIYETATAIQTIIVNQTLISNQDITKQNYTVNFESDCALIPKKDITKNYHRFIEGSEF